MSNRTLVVSIVVILVLFICVVLIVRQRSNNDVNGVASDQQAPASSSTPDQSASSLRVASSTPPQATTTAAANGACQRDFNQNTLTNAKVNIQNRIVEIDVKDFGKIQLEFYPSDAPKTVENFLRLANSGYYDCLTFHRVAAGFVIQGGDPNGNGSGGQSAFGAPFADELNPNTPSYKTGYVKGVLAMANSGPNTNGSQFFILLADQTSWMPHNYTIFGKVSSGQDVVDKIGQLPTTPPGDGMPNTPVVMQSVKIIK